MASGTMWAARLVILTAFLDLFMQFPVVAPYARSLGASAALVGLIVAAYSATNMAGNVVAGIALDRWGRRRPVIGGLLATAASLAGYALVATPAQFLVARAVHGLAAAVLTPGAFAILGDSAAPERRARVMGTAGVIIAGAAVLGPPLAGVVRDRLGASAVFLGDALLLVIAAVLFQRVVQESRANSASRESLPRPTAAAYLALWTRPRLAGAYVAALALTVGLGTLVTHLPLALVARGESAARTGMAFSIFAAVAMVGMAGPLSRLGDRYGRIWPVSGGLVTIAGGLLLLGTAGGIAAVAAAMAVFGLGFGLLFPSATALVADGAGREARGAAFGMFYAIYSLGVVAGSLVSGAANEWLGDFTGTPFLIGAATAVAAAPVVVWLARQERFLAAPAPA